MALPGNCAYFRTCMDYLLSSVWESDHVVPEEFRELLDPNYDRCFCANCMPGLQYGVKQAGEPQRPYSLPVGWARVGVRLDEGRAKHFKIFDKWNVAFHGTSPRALYSIITNGGLMLPGSTLMNGDVLGVVDGHYTDSRKDFVFSSPSILYCESPVYAKSATLPDGRRIKVVLQVRQKPGGYEIQSETILNAGERHTHIDPYIPNSELEYKTKATGNTMIYGVLMKIYPVGYKDVKVPPAISNPGIPKSVGASSVFVTSIHHPAPPTAHGFPTQLPGAAAAAFMASAPVAPAVSGASSPSTSATTFDTVLKATAGGTPIPWRAGGLAEPGLSPEDDSRLKSLLPQLSGSSCLSEDDLEFVRKCADSLAGRTEVATRLPELIACASRFAVARHSGGVAERLMGCIARVIPASPADYETRFVSAGGVPLTLSVLQTHESNPGVLAECCAALKAIAKSVAKTSEVNTITTAVVTALKAYSQTHKPMADKGCAALNALCTCAPDVILPQLLAQDVIPLTVRIIKQYTGEVDVLQSSCALLSRFAGVPAGQQAIEANEGIPMLANVMKQHVNSAMIQDSACAVFSEFATMPQYHPLLKEAEVVTAVHTAFSRHFAHASIKKNANKFMQTIKKGSAQK